MKQPKDPYVIVRRIDWIRARLLAGQSINSTLIATEFGVSNRTALRDLHYVRQFFAGRLYYRGLGRTFYLR